MRVVILLSVLGGALLSSSVARAQATTPTPSAGASAGADAEARALFDAAVVAMDSGRYENALDYFERSYALSHRSQLLFNIGSAAERLRYDERALAAYEQFLAENPDSESRDVVVARIAILRRSIETRALPVQTTPTEVEPPTEVEAPASPPPAAATHAEPHRRRGVNVPMVASGSALLAGAGGMAVYWHDRQAAVNDCNDRTTATAVCVTSGDLRHERNLGRIGTLVLAGTGAADLVFGLFVGMRDLGHEREEEDDHPSRGDFPRASLMCAPNGPGVSCSGRF